MTKIDWDKLWDEFDEWCEPEEDRCKMCFRSENIYKEWDEQQEKIQKLVEKQLRKRKG